MNIFNIENAFKKTINRRWDTMYWAIDVHDTIMPSTYNDDEPELYPHSSDVLLYLQSIPYIKTIMFTCSHRDSIDRIIAQLAKYGFAFDFVNENPECSSTSVSNFSHKFYYNVLLDDKAGFEGNKDWKTTHDELKRCIILYDHQIMEIKSGTF